MSSIQDLWDRNADVFRRSDTVSTRQAFALGVLASLRATYDCVPPERRESIVDELQRFVEDTQLLHDAHKEALRP